MKKYELTSETINVYGITLYRIKALISIENFGVSTGDLGGFIENESNLDHFGNAWVYGNAWVSGDARVYGNAWVSGNARVYGNAWVSGDARVYGNAWVSGNAQVSGDARVYGNAWVSGNARVYGNARVFGDAILRQCSHDKLKTYITIGLIGDDRYITFEKPGRIINAGCFSDTLENFEKAVKEKYGNESDYYPIIEFFKSL